MSALALLATSAEAGDRKRNRRDRDDYGNYRAIGAMTDGLVLFASAIGTMADGLVLFASAIGTMTDGPCCSIGPF